MSLPPNTLLLEIGTEELPAAYVQTAWGQWQSRLQTILTEAGLPEAQLNLQGTPRRIAIEITGLPEQTQNKTEWLKGPAANIAFKEGQKNQGLSPAGLGFLRKNGMETTEAEALTKEEAGYLWLQKTTPGQQVAPVLAPQLLEAVLGLTGPRFMRWATTERMFSRPVRWLLALWNDQPLELRLDLGNENVLEAKPFTRGHRTLSTANNPEYISVSSAQTYWQTVREQGSVEPEIATRNQLILQQLQAKAAQTGGQLVEDEELLNHVVWLVESPHVVLGRFDEAYLSLPACVLVTVMRAHQKYFAVETTSGELLPVFLCVSNASAEADLAVAAGNERVLKARFEDARFFYEEDMKIPLENRLQKLSGVTFQKGLGTLADKTQRLEALCTWLADELAYSTEEKTSALRAARLSKADLVTAMVFELTELQGQIGRAYALKQGENQAVANALAAQYEETPANQPVSLALSLADKMDTLMAVFSQPDAKLPTGSKDPLGLRRLVNGLWLTVFQNQSALTLKALARQAHQTLGPLARLSFEETWQRLAPFMLTRFETLIESDDLLVGQADFVPAVQAVQCPLLTQPAVFTARLKRLAQTDAVWLNAQLKTPAVRISQFLKSDYQSEVTVAAINSQLFNSSEEKALFETTQAVLKDSANNKSWEALATAVQALFDHLLVNDPDTAIRANRLALLSLIQQTYENYWGHLSLLELALPEAVTV